MFSNKGLLITMLKQAISGQSANLKVKLLLMRRIAQCALCCSSDN